jgi:molybdenum cofactor cytidylyltransferase
MGESKQLLPFRGRSLVRHMAEIALEVVDTVVVVTGADAPKVESEFSDLSVNVIRNEEWENGISSSIRVGLSGLFKIDPSTDGVIFMVCDQPFVSASLLKDIIENKNKNKHLIIASAYGSTLGTPALFDKDLFPALLKLKGDSGAKKIILENVDSVLKVEFPKGELDVDTPEDYKSLLQKS